MGIGFDTVLEFSKNPIHNIVALARDELKLLQLKELCLVQNNHEIQIVVCDISTIERSEFEVVLSKFSKIDILINNAGLLINKPFLDLVKTEWQAIFDVNIFGVVAITKIVFPKLKLSSNAHIVNIGSMGGFPTAKKFKGLSAYSSSKAALANLTECLAEEFAEDNISCNCLCLGAVNSGMLKKAFPSYTSPTSTRSMASYICHFALTAQQFMNGSVIPVTLRNP